MGSPRRKAGLLGPEVEGYRAWLSHRGYTPQTIRNMLKDLCQVGVWLSVEGLEVAQFNEDRASAFLAARRETGHRKVGGPVRCCLWWPTCVRPAWSRPLPRC